MYKLNEANWPSRNQYSSSCLRVEAKVANCGAFAFNEKKTRLRTLCGAKKKENNLQPFEMLILLLRHPGHGGMNVRDGLERVNQVYNAVPSFHVARPGDGRIPYRPMLHSSTHLLIGIVILLSKIQR